MLRGFFCSRCLAPICAVALSAATLQAGDILRVPAEYATIQDAINAAQAGDTVLVADGTYRGAGNRDIELLGKAITVRSEHGPRDCIIDCQGSPANPHRGFRFHEGERPTTIIDGLTVKSGYAPDDPACGPMGGGVLCTNGSWPTLRNCIITLNTAGQYG